MNTIRLARPDIPRDLFLMVSRRHNRRHDARRWIGWCRACRPCHHPASCRRHALGKQWESSSRGRYGRRSVRSHRSLIDRMDEHDPNFFHHLEMTLHQGRSYSISRYRRWSRHPRIPIALILRFQTKPWDFIFLLEHRLWIDTHLDRCIRHHRMNFTAFSKNPYLTLSHIRRYLESKWDWRALALHPALDPQTIWDLGDDRLYHKWRWAEAYRHPRLSPHMYSILQSSYRWSPTLLLHNLFHADTGLIRIAAHRIQRFVTAQYLHRTMRARLGSIHRMTASLPSSLIQIILEYVLPVHNHYCTEN